MLIATCLLISSLDIHFFHLVMIRNLNINIDVQKYFYFMSI